MRSKKSELYREALQARKKSYSPYSKFKIGAAVLTGDGKIVSGCNVENSSYGATICAERVAILKAVSQGAKKILEVAVVSNANPPWNPCGMCRQTIAEFATPSTLVHVGDLKNIRHSILFKKLFPSSFDPEKIDDYKKDT